MDVFIAPLGALAVLYALKRILMIDLSVRDAGGMLRNGAVLVDVRTPEEFGDGKVPGAVNIPLDELRNKAGAVVPGRDTVVLLYCRSGTRSYIGKRIMKKMDYTTVFNAGSFRRARKIAAYAGSQTDISGSP
ncbi:MAG: rhodanese-like domain-containing protein [Nitrospiraceae bacterium]|nr:MAG: rhodanese-like domain-containing protein [Nitrospiraceae bacterium]